MKTDNAQKDLLVEIHLPFLSFPFLIAYYLVYPLFPVPLPPFFFKGTQYSYWIRWSYCHYHITIRSGSRLMQWWSRQESFMAEENSRRGIRTYVPMYPCTHVPVVLRSRSTLHTGRTDVTYTYTYTYTHIVLRTRRSKKQRFVKQRPRTERGRELSSFKSHSS